MKMFPPDCQIEFSEHYIYIHWNIIEISFIKYLLSTTVQNFKVYINSKWVCIIHIKLQMDLINFTINLNDIKKNLWPSLNLSIMYFQIIREFLMANKSFCLKSWWQEIVIN